MVEAGNLQQQVAHGTRLTSRVVYTLDDGSVDDETTVFTQGPVFHVVSDHHIQHGTIFDKPPTLRDPVVSIELDGMHFEPFQPQASK